MKRIGIESTVTNTQIRSAFVTVGLETGMRDNEMRAVIGHRSETALNLIKILVWSGGKCKLKKNGDRYCSRQRLLDRFSKTQI